jgi:Zn-dependent protease with chaperone function
MRTVPAMIALILTVISAMPGYLHGEPIQTNELPGFGLIALALVGLYAILSPFARVLWMSVRTLSKTANWVKTARFSECSSAVPVLELAGDRALVVAAGVFRKRIFVSTLVRNLLSPRELRAVLRHEAAHCRQNHNLVRFLYTVVPHLLPQTAFDEDLHETIEYAADDEACEVPGDALNLASAVVVLARHAVSAPQMLYTGLVERQSAATLERRVERLVSPRKNVTRRLFGRLTTGCAAIVTVAAAIGSLPSAQHAFRETLELLVR